MSTEPISFERDDRGLIKGVVYHFTPDGRVDYLKMVDPKFLYITDDKKDRVCQEQGVTLDKVDLTKVNEKWLRITIGGINQLAQLRGIISVDYPTIVVADGSVTASCSIAFVGNFETDGVPFTCAAIASANIYNVDANFSPYLATFAENRAFTRCVKRALQINVVSDEEIGGDGKQALQVFQSAMQEIPSPASTPVAGFEARHLLETRCSDKKITFEQMKMAAQNHQNAWIKPPDQWTSFEDLQPNDVFFILGKMDQAEAKGNGKAKK